MLKPLIISIILLFSFQTIYAQKKYINRKVAQKNYDGYLLMTEKKYHEALQLFDEAISDDSEAFFIYQNRALCKLHLKDTIGAIADFKTNINLEPNNAETRYALGNIYKHWKDSANAINYFVPAIEIAAEDFSQTKLVYMSQFAGNYYRLNEKYDSALVFYNRVKQYTPENASVYINCAVCSFYLDSLDKFCANLEKAFVLGGDINCIALSAYCNGCTHLLEARGHTDTLSRALDTRLAGIISDTIYYRQPKNRPYDFWEKDNNRKVKVYFNENWQICLPEKASYYREAFWTKALNNFGGEFKDYYITGELFATGRLERTKIVGDYAEYYKNGNPKLHAQFNHTQPIGIWNYFLKDGDLDMKIIFKNETFEIKIINKNNPNAEITSGTGSFEIVTEKWKDLSFVLKGEFLKTNRNGVWTYQQNDEIILKEKYKNGKFRNGFVESDFGRLPLTKSGIQGHIFIPPHLTQITALYFSSIEAARHYSFIKRVEIEY
ncbi:hypothetical protein [uncultured Draconibacterium sp.]|uniref:hypothetical protein n=1 Tax=uncultured Draconibacterium sp. TaxID=1573823 RepID=UPI0025D24B3F|nr:hypothetical protein [uncultured Draconibacterium sp.]